MRHNLRRRGALPKGVSVVCPLCEEEDETVDYFLKLFNCSWVIRSGVEWT